MLRGGATIEQSPVWARHSDNTPTNPGANVEFSMTMRLGVAEGPEAWSRVRAYRWSQRTRLWYTLTQWRVRVGRQLCRGFAIRYNKIEVV